MQLVAKGLETKNYQISLIKWVLALEKGSAQRLVSFVLKRPNIA